MFVLKEFYCSMNEECQPPINRKLFFYTPAPHPNVDLIQPTPKWLTYLYNYLFVDLTSIDRETYIVDPHGFFDEEADQSSTRDGQQGPVPQRLGCPLQLSLTNIYLKQSKLV